MNCLSTLRLKPRALSRNNQARLKENKAQGKVFGPRSGHSPRFDRLGTGSNDPRNPEERISCEQT